MDRYHRQHLLPQIGAHGQARLERSGVLLIGCGALGTVIAEQLVRAGIGQLRICDRDVVELTNLQRQTLFTERDVQEGIPKAVAARSRLMEANSNVFIEARVIDVQSDNVESLLDLNGTRADVIVDGSDNADVRYLMNDVAVKHGIPWVYGACVGTEGRVMSVTPGKTPCLRCIFRDPPGPGELETCDTVGVLCPAAAIVASLQSTAVIRLLVGDDSEPALLKFDAWTSRFRLISVADARIPDCPACGQRQFEFLNRSARETAELCGRNAVQVRPPTQGSRVNLDAVAQRLAGIGGIQRTPYLLRFSLPDDAVCFTLFPDGRALVQGTDDPNRARSIYARYVGS